MADKANGFDFSKLTQVIRGFSQNLEKAARTVEEKGPELEEKGRKFVDELRSELEDAEKNADKYGQDVAEFVTELKDRFTEWVDDVLDEGEDFDFDSSFDVLVSDMAQPDGLPSPVATHLQGILYHLDRKSSAGEKLEKSIKYKRPFFGEFVTLNERELHFVLNNRLYESQVIEYIENNGFTLDLDLSDEERGVLQQAYDSAGKV